MKREFTMGMFASKEDLYRAKASHYKSLAQHLQSKIDALMLEYCPSEITKEQWEEYEANIAVSVLDDSLQPHAEGNTR